MVNCLIGTRGRGWLRPLLVGEHRRLGAGLRLPRPPSLVGEHTTLQVMPPGTAAHAAVLPGPYENLVDAVAPVIGLAAVAPGMSARVRFE